MPIQEKAGPKMRAQESWSKTARMLVQECWFKNAGLRMLGSKNARPSGSRKVGPRMRVKQCESKNVGTRMLVQECKSKGDGLHMRGQEWYKIVGPRCWFKIAGPRMYVQDWVG